jgi:MFS family permease
MGIAGAVSALTIALFSPVIQMLIGAFGWRVAYYCEFVIILALTLPFTLFVFVKQPSDINAQPYGFRQHFESRGKELPDGPAHKGVPVGMALKSVPFVALFLLAGLAAMIGAGFDSHIPGFADSMGFDPAFGAAMVSALAFGSFCEKLLMGYVNDRFGVWVGVTCELAIVAVGIVLLITMHMPWLLLFAVFLFGVQDSFTSVSLPLLVRSVFGIKDYSQIYAWTRVGAGLFGSFAAVFVGMSYDISGSYTPAFTGALVLCTLIALTVLVAKRTKDALRAKANMAQI